MACYDADGEMRHGRRERFRHLLRTETCTSVVDVGAGPRLDALLCHFVDAAFRRARGVGGGVE